MPAAATTPGGVPPPRGFGARILNFIEWAGNKLPDPAMLFVWALLITWALSALLAPVEFDEIDPRSLPSSELREHIYDQPETVLFGPLQVEAIRATENPILKADWVRFGPLSVATLQIESKQPEKIRIKNQLTGKSLAEFLVKMVKNFTDFRPLGVVLVALLGVGVADHTGFINAIVKWLMSITPQKLLTPMILLVAIVSHSAGDTGYVLVVPLGGIIFYAAGRHPVAGIVAAFAGVSGGFSANFLPSGLDPLLQGLTQEAAQIVEPGRLVNPLCNLAFTAGSCLVIILAGWYITDRIIEPRLRGTRVDGDPKDMPVIDPITPAERRGMIAGLLSMVVCGALLALWALPGDSPLRNAKGELTGAKAPLMDAIVPLIFLFFLVPGIVHGYVAGTVKSHRDVVKAMSKSMGTMGYYLVLAFFAAQFTAAFSESNLGTLLAVKGANFLKEMQVRPSVTIIGILLLASMVNLLIGSASAKWALLAPIFVPMLMGVGISPELTQAGYRVGDSSTNIITPLMPYFALVVDYCRRYVKDTGIGTLASLMIPYSMVFLTLWTLLLLLYWQLGLPLGLQASYTYP